MAWLIDLPFEDHIRQAEVFFWQCWQMASDSDPNTWELLKALDLRFVP